MVCLLAVMTVNMNLSSAKKRVFSSGSIEEQETAKTISLNHMAQRIGNYGIHSVSDLKVENIMVDELSMAHTRLQQMHEGVPVFGGEAIVHLNSDASIFTVTDSLITNVNVRTTPDLSATEAVDRATSLYGCSDCLTSAPKVDLWILRRNDKDHLVYRVQLDREDGSKETSMPVYFIDAHTGKKVWHYNNLQTVAGSGSTFYAGTVALDVYFKSPSYYLEDIARKQGTFTFKNGTTSAYRITSTSTAFAKDAAIDAQFGATKTYDYYKNVHGRNGIDAAGGPAYYTSADGVTGLISSVVHYSTNYNNAYWNSQFMTYGDGDGSTFTPLTTVDICGHEMTHGVTERTANLTYSNESGALNESMSDVLGSMVERYTFGESAKTWMIGEDAYTPGTAGDALRYMDDTHRGSQPDHYSEKVNTTSDNGGVHTNSGISNYVFYLVAKGGTHHLGGSVTGIGADKAAAIWYKALTTYMTASTNFAAARTATENAASAIYGASSAEKTSVSQAWYVCGVGAAPGGGTPPPPPPAGTDLFANGGFETSVSPTVLSGTNAYYVSPGNYPHAGTGYVYLGTTNNVASQLYQQISIPSTATSANLTFWLNVTSDETTTTTAYDKLYVEVRNTAGTLLTTFATYSNLNKGTAGVYSQKGSFSLLAYKGQTVRVQFRATTDSSLQTTFRIDDVSVK